MCFDLYAHLKEHTGGTNKVLKDIKKGIELNLKQNYGDAKILSKLKEINGVKPTFLTNREANDTRPLSSAIGKSADLITISR